MKILILISVLTFLVILDKGLTIANIIQVNKHFPESNKEDYFKVEQNPMAKWFFETFGLWRGSFIFGVVSILIGLVAYLILALLFGERVSLWIICIIYGFVIFNNFYFLLKYSKVIV